MKNKAYTSLEIIVIFSIILLLFTLGFSTFYKIRESSLVNAYEKGQKLDKEQMEVVRRYYKRNKKSKTQENQSVVEGDKVYTMVPASEIKEVIIDGEKYYLWINQ